MTENIDFELNKPMSVAGDSGSRKNYASRNICSKGL